MRIICISDTHGKHHGLKIPEGDLLLHAGDLSMSGDEGSISDFNLWLGTLPHKYKVIIAGNHDFLFENDPELARSLITNAIYLEDKAVTIEGLKIYGSPWQPWFFDWAFNLPRGKALKERWEMIPNDTDILITHGPPHNIFDRTAHGEPVGCEELMSRINNLSLKLHLFGHIHEAYGMKKQNSTIFCNASICTLSYNPTNPPWSIEI